MKKFCSFFGFFVLVVFCVLIFPQKSLASQSPLHTAKYFIFKNINACYYGTCTPMSLNQYQVNIAASNFMNTWANYMNTNLGGKMTITPEVVVISNLTTINFGTNGGWGWIPPDVLQTLIGDQVDNNVDFVLATSPTPNPQYCGLSDTDADNLSVPYTFIFPGCVNPADTMIHESIHLIQGGLENVMKRSDMYDVYHNWNGDVYPQSLCGNTSPSDNYNWFPNIDEADKVPDFEACQSYYGDWSGYNTNYANTNQAALHDGYNSGLYFYQGVLANHFPDQAHGVGDNYTSNHCRDGVQDYSETGIDTGGNCLTDITNPLPLYTPAGTFTPAGWGTSPTSTPNLEIHFSNAKLNNVWTVGTASATLATSKVATDSAGNFYYAGIMNATSIAFNPDGINDVQTATTSAIYLTKINADGNYGFTRLIDGASTVSVSGLKTDADGNVYLLGQFIGTVNFNPLGADSKSSSNLPQNFLTKINADGNYGFTYVWSDAIYLSDLAIGSDDNIYLVGNISNDTGATNLDPTGGTDYLSSSAWKSSFYIKLNTNGTYAYSKIIYSSNFVYANALSVDTNSNVLLFGSFTTDLTNFNASGDMYTATSSVQAVFINKFDSGGNYVDTYVISPSDSQSTIFLSNFAVDQNNNIYLFGLFDGTVNFDPTGGNNSKTSSPMVKYLTKINNDGTYAYTLAWNNNNFNPGKILFDSDGKIYLTGSSYGGTDYNPAGNDTPASFGGSDNFLTVLNPDGSYVQTYLWGGTGDDYVSDAVFGPNSVLYFVGRTASPYPDYDPSSKNHILAIKGNQDGFIMSFTPQQGSLTFTPTGWETSSPTALNPTIHFTTPKYKNAWTIGTASATLEADKVATDSNGNLFYAGVTSPTTAAFNPDGTDDVQTAAASAIYLTKVNSDGTYGYTHLIDGATGISVSALKTDSDGNVYLLGRFIGTVTFFGIDTKTTGVDAQTFLVKLNADGSYGYTYTWPGTGTYISGLVIGSDNSLYLGGEINSDTGGSNLDPTGGTDNISSEAWQTAFYVKLNADGSYGYTRIINSSNDIDFNNIAIDSNNNVLLAGSFSTDLTNYNSSGSAYTQTASGDGTFIDKFDSGGGYVDSFVIDSGPDNQYTLTNFAVDQSNNLYLHGLFNGTVNFNPTGGDDSKTTASNVRFLTKIQNDGTYGYTLTWNNNNFNANKIIFDSDGRVYLFGDSHGDTNFNPVGTDILPSLSGSDEFLTILNADSSYVHTNLWGGSGDDTVNDAVFDLNSTLRIVGSTTSQNPYYINGEDSIPRKGTQDATILAVDAVTFGGSPPSSAAENKPGPVSCTSPVPLPPSLFQIWTANGQANLYFVPTVSPSSGYTISYGPYDNAELYAVSFDYQDKSGAIPYTINYLNPATKYYFKVRANNGCMSGEWSNILSIAIPASSSKAKTYSYKSVDINVAGANSGKSCSYTVQPGDSLWIIAQKMLGQGSKYLQIILTNALNYPSLNSSTIIQPNWNFSVGC